MNEIELLEDEAFLEFAEDGTAEVSVSPVNIKSTVDRSEAFLKDPSATELKLTVIANWKFGLFAGGLVSLLTVLYVVGLIGLVFQPVEAGEIQVVPGNRSEWSNR